MDANLANLILPQGIRYDGIQESPDGDLLQFTDVDDKSHAFRATFYGLRSEMTATKLAQLTADIRAKFAPKPQRTPRHESALPPAVPNHPKHFAPAGEYRG